MGFVVVHDVIYYEDDEVLYINKHFRYINVIPPLIKLKVNGRNMIMDYLTPLDTRPHLKFNNPFTCGLPTINLQYMDHLWCRQHTLVTIVDQINDIKLTDLK